MSESVQHYLVYTIVGISGYQLLKPLLELVYKKVKNRNKKQESEDNHSFYSNSCSKCNLKH